MCEASSESTRQSRKQEILKSKDEKSGWQLAGTVTLDGTSMSRNAKESVK